MGNLCEMLYADTELQNIKRRYREKYGVPAEPFVAGKYKNIQEYKDCLKKLLNDEKS